MNRSEVNRLCDGGGHQKLKMIDYRFKQNSLHKVGRVSSFSLENAMSLDHTTGVVAVQEPATTWLTVRRRYFLKHGRFSSFDWLTPQTPCFSYLPSKNNNQRKALYWIHSLSVVWNRHEVMYGINPKKSHLRWCHTPTAIPCTLRVIPYQSFGLNRKKQVIRLAHSSNSLF